MAILVSEAWKKKYQIANELKDYARFITLGSIKITPAKIALSNTAVSITTRAPVIDLRVKTVKKRIPTALNRSVWEGFCSLQLPEDSLLSIFFSVCSITFSARMLSISWKAGSPFCEFIWRSPDAPYGLLFSLLLLHLFSAFAWP